jgi:hypothetical protein
LRRRVVGRPRRRGRRLGCWSRGRCWGRSFR